MKTIQRSDGAVILRECESVSALRAKVRAFRDLYDIEPSITMFVPRSFTDAKNGELIFSGDFVVTIGRKYVSVDVGDGAPANLGDAEIDKVSFYLRAKATI